MYPTWGHDFDGADFVFRRACKLILSRYDLDIVSFFSSPCTWLRFDYRPVFDSRSHELCIKLILICSGSGSPVGVGPMSQQRSKYQIQNHMHIIMGERLDNHLAIRLATSVGNTVLFQKNRSTLILNFERSKYPND